MIKLKDLLNEGADARFEKHANEYIKRVQKAHDIRMKKDTPNVEANKFMFEKGKRYWRVVARRDVASDKSVHSFLDTTNGDVLKAAGWKSPAKHARGNIYKPDFGMGGVGDYGAKYMR